MNPFSWKLQAFLYCLAVSKAIIITKGTLQNILYKNSTKFFASFMRYPPQLGGCSQFNFILFFSLEIPPKKKSIEILWNLFEGGEKKIEDKGFKARFLILS